MKITDLLTLAQTAAPTAAPDGTGSVRLGLAVIGLVLVLVMMLAFMWGRASAARRRGRACPTCGAMAGRGSFCAKCGTRVD
jgi:hypothetical protein